ncbi:hypothetical protein BDV24DRAFT_143073 [Aspergillus arachidicola]|uniref:Uncharacterized protein n=1 Tax=Aspergillus arachidicola TaxID=656916 RepID=A0A5N6XUB5_9EURO|nr:hypothetical protein BDV24DRAFT_143073 [Aspergillus arachidicola]
MCCPEPHTVYIDRSSSNTALVNSELASVAVAKDVTASSYHSQLSECTRGFSTDKQCCLLSSVINLP